MPGHNHPSVRQALIQCNPPSLKQLDDLTGVHRGHLRWMSQHSLDLRMLAIR